MEKNLCIFIFGCFLGFISCSNEASPSELKVDYTKVNYNEDSLVLFSELNRPIRWKIDSTRGIDSYSCIISSEETSFNLGFGYMGFSLHVDLEEKIPELDLKSYGCTSIDHYKFIPSKQILRIDTTNQHEHLIGFIEYQGTEDFENRRKRDVGYFDENYDPLQINICGYFKLKVNGKGQNHEYDRYRMLALKDYKNNLDVCKDKDCKSINASRIGLHNVPTEILNLKSLTKINLEQNNLNNYDFKNLSRLTKLKWLNLSSNQLTEFPINVLANRKLEKLILSFNDIKRLPVEEILDSNIKYLNLIGNEINESDLNKLSKSIEIRI